MNGVVFHISESVITTSDDRVVPTARQLSLGRLIPGATIDVVRGGHDVCLRSPAALAAALGRACSDLDRRIGTARRQAAVFA